MGYQTTVAISGKDGVRLIDQETFDVIITDLMMNDVSGMGVLEQAKASLPEAEVILVTGHGTIPSAVEAMQRGAFNYLQKPLDLKQLRVTVLKASEAVQLKRNQCRVAATLG